MMWIIYRVPSEGPNEDFSNSLPVGQKNLQYDAQRECMLLNAWNVDWANTHYIVRKVTDDSAKQR